MNTNCNPIQIHISSNFDKIDGYQTSVHYTDISVSYVNVGFAGRICYYSNADLKSLLDALTFVVASDEDYDKNGVVIQKDTQSSENEYYTIDSCDGFVAINTLHDMEVLRDTISDFFTLTPNEP